MGADACYRMLRGIAFAGLIAFLLPGFSYSSAEGQSRTSFRLGVPSSGWAFVERERNWTPTSERNSLNWRFDFVNWSVFAGIVSVAAFWAARKVRPKSAALGTPSSSQAPRAAGSHLSGAS